MYTAKSIRIMDKKRRELFKTNEFRERLLEDLIEAIKTKKDVYLFSYNLTDEENNYTKEEDENVNYYAWLTEEEMTEIQRELFIHFWVGEEEDMDYLHLSLDYVASENITEDTMMDDENVFLYNSLFIFWDK